MEANVKRWTIYFLRAFLGLLAILLLAAQVVIFPVLSGELAQQYPELAWARWPLLAAVIVLLAPTSRALLTYAVARSRSHTRTLLVGLPHPRPPSLLVLSISRT